MKQLFKYLPEPRDIFDDGFIRLSQVAALNDPFEASFCKASLDELSSHFDESSAYDTKFGQISFSDYVKIKIHHIGVISFSENKENLLMWAHYANEHKGLIAGIAQHRDFSIFHNLFRACTLINTSFGNEFSPFDGVAKPVSYRKGLRYRNDKFDNDYSNICVEGADRILYEVFMQKSDEWIYEQEHRVVLRLEQADRVIINSIEDIENIKIRNLLSTNPNVSIDQSTGRCTVDLWLFDDENLRIAVAINLVELSTNPSSIFLMKLSASSINNCLIGLNSKLQKQNVLDGHANSVGYLDVWKAKKNNDYYSLEFIEI
ncbi:MULTISPECIES: DUF2971 domain-containing protein [Photobacterium]|uniref:DUF2971 domain-containing protein n=1 Tax=Photobacterium TaxID=657 RepID=UPI0007F9143E|nr:MULTISPECIES: DUF2971 domain-containing protein [Photobacterium]OBU35442.1 hypothetical protein AYY24_02525 [Photobacterium phosphoreum]PSW36524.1 DUF2971 domain-containing protein [Photobacterium phosphoreum]